MATGHNQKRKVAVIGGGIAGLTAALAFARTGAGVTVYEQAPELRAFGAGIQITPNGACVLQHFGLSDVMDMRSIRACGVEPMDAVAGKQITSFDLTGFAPPYRFFHRADLLDLLYRAAMDHGVQFRFGARIAALATDGTFALDGQQVHADITIGAEGLHSAARTILNGPDQPFFTGQVAWRAVIDDPDAPPVARIWMAPKQHMVTYPLLGGKLNVVAVQERRDWTAEGWNHKDDPVNLRTAFAGLSGRVMGVLSRVDQVHLWGLFRHPVANHWHGRNLAIVGDAAHPTLPFLAQGANLAIEDAYVLAACCDAAPLDYALPHYQTLRRDRVIRAIEAANRNAVNYHLSGPRRAASHAVLKGLGKMAPGAFLRRMAWLYDHDVTRDV